MRMRKACRREKKFGSLTGVNRDIGDYLRIGEEVGGARVWLGVNNTLSDLCRVVKLLNCLPLI